MIKIIRTVSKKELGVSVFLQLNRRVFIRQKEKGLIDILKLSICDTKGR